MENIIQYFNVPKGGIQSLYFNPNGQQLLVSTTNGLLLYRVNSKSRPFNFTGARSQPFNAIRGILSQDGQYACGVSIQGQIGLWKMHSESPCLLKTAHQARINDMSTWTYNDYVATASHDKSVMIWDINNLQEIDSSKKGDDSKKKLRYVASFSRHNAQVTSVSCCPTMNIILSGDAYGAVALWDVRSKSKASPLWSEPANEHPRAPVLSLDFERHGVMFAVSRDPKRVLIRDIRFPDNIFLDFSLTDEIRDKEIPEKSVESRFLTSFPAIPSCVKFNPVCPKVIVTGPSGNPTMYDTEDQRLGTDLQGHDVSQYNHIVAMDWSPDGKMIATADSNGMVIIWKTPKVEPPKNDFFTVEQASFSTTKPSNTSLTPEALYIQLQFLNTHISQLNHHLSDQEQRVMNLANAYPAIGNFTVYDI